MTETKKFIVDTNILLSGLLVKNSIPSVAINKARQEGIIIFSENTFLEFESVLFRKKFDRYFSVDERLLL